MTTPHDIVYLAVRDGDLIRGECEVGVDCKGNIEGHHEDYSVRSMCVGCVNDTISFVILK